MLNLGPCSMLPPHLHPRASNYVVAIHGNTTTYMFEENGARLVTETLTPGKATIFPQASMHMMVNNGTSMPNPGEDMCDGDEAPKLRLHKNTARLTTRSPNRLICAASA